MKIPLKRMAVLVVAVVGASLFFAGYTFPAVQLGEIKDYDSPSISEVSGSGYEDIYRWNGVLRRCSWKRDYADGYAGQVGWQWWLERIDETNPEYDFFSVSVRLILDSSLNRISPPPEGIEYADYWTVRARVEMDLSPQQRVQDSRPLTQGGEISISTNTDESWGGMSAWKLDFSDDVSGRQHRFDFWALIATLEGVTLNFNLTLRWELKSSGLEFPCWHHADYLAWTKTLNLVFSAGTTPSPSEGNPPNL